MNLLIKLFNFTIVLILKIKLKISSLFITISIKQIKHQITIYPLIIYNNEL